MGDKAILSHKGRVEALDRTLQDTKSITTVMEVAIGIVSGDFRQTLPVVPRGTRANKVEDCLKASYLWLNVKTISCKNVWECIWVDTKILEDLKVYY